MQFVEENSFPVVCIREHPKTSKTDTTLFFTFDARFDEYVLWGRRGIETDPPFMFRFDRFNDLYNFLEVCVLVDKDYSKISMILYNYNNFPLDFDVSYSYLHDNMDGAYEITGYDDVRMDRLSRNHLRKWAHVCRYSYNRIDGEIV